MAYIGRTPDSGSYEKQSITGDSSTTTFSLDFTVGTSSALIVSTNGTVLEPEVGYSLSNGGSNIVFSSAPTSGHATYVVFLGIARDVDHISSDGIITSRTELSETPASNDLFLVYDTSAAALKKVSNLYVGDINNKTDLTTGIQGADELLIFDNSAGVNKKVNLDNLIVGQTELAEVAAADDVLLIYDTSATEIKKIQKSNIATTLTYSKATATGDGSTTTLTINSGRAVDNILVFVNGICLVPTDDYTVSGTTLTFATAPSSGAEITVRYLPI